MVYPNFGSMKELAEGARCMTSKLTRSHEEATIERFRRDPPFAAEYLDAILKDGDEGELLQALQRLSKAFGGVAEIANRAELNTKSLYRALSARGNPEMKTLVAILKAMGMRLSIKPR
jgi:probable addiction module antidote protein